MQIPPRSVSTEQIPMPCQHKLDENGQIIPDSAPLCEKAVITQGTERIETVCLSIIHNPRSHTDTHTHETKIFPWITKRKPKETDGKSGPGSSSMSSILADINSGDSTSKRKLEGNTKFIKKLEKGKTKYPEHKQQHTDPKSSVDDKSSTQAPEKEPDGAWGGQEILLPSVGLTLEEMELAGDDGLIATSGDFEAGSPQKSPQLTFLPAEQRPARRTTSAQSEESAGLETLLTDLGNLDMSTEDFTDLHGGEEPSQMTREELSKVRDEQDQQKELQEKQRKKMQQRYLSHFLMSKDKKPDDKDSGGGDDSSEA